LSRFLRIKLVHSSDPVRPCAFIGICRNALDRFRCPFVVTNMRSHRTRPASRCRIVLKCPCSIKASGDVMAIRRRQRTLAPGEFRRYTEFRDLTTQKPVTIQAAALSCDGKPPTDAPAANPPGFIFHLEPNSSVTLDVRDGDGPVVLTLIAKPCGGTPAVPTPTPVSQPVVSPIAAPEPTAIALPPHSLAAASEVPIAYGGL
jgi:hypothetical protein